MWGKELQRQVVDVSNHNLRGWKKAIFFHERFPFVLLSFFSGLRESDQGWLDNSMLLWKEHTIA